MKLSEDNKEFWFAFVEERLSKSFVIKEQRDISYGVQFIMKSGEIVNVYETTRFSLGGKRNFFVKDLMFKLMEEFRSTLSIDEMNSLKANQMCRTHPT